MSLENPARYQVELAMAHDAFPIAIHLKSSNRLLKVAMVIPDRALTREQAQAVCDALNKILDKEYEAKAKELEGKEDKKGKKK